MNVLQSFTISTMKVHKKWTVVTVIGVIISAAMLSGVTTFTASFMELLQRQQIADYGKWTAYFSDVPASDAAVWAKTSEDTVMLQREIGYAELEGSRNPSKPYLYITAYDTESFRNFFISVDSGRLPLNEHEIVLSDEIAESSGIQYFIGDEITVGVGDRMYPDGTPAEYYSPYTEEYYSYNEDTEESINLGPEILSVEAAKTYTVVGFIDSAITEPFWGSGYSCFTALPSGIAASEEDVTLYLWNQDVPFDYYSLVRSQAEQLGYSAEQIVFNDSYLRYCAVQEPGNGQDLMFTLVFVIVAIIILASVSLIYNAFSISVSERTRHLGLLASAGATRRQKRIHVHFEGFLVAIMGIPLGILFGILGIKCTFVFIEPILVSLAGWNQMELHTVVSVWTIGITIILSALTVFFSVLIPAIRASRIMPIDAIRQSKEIRLTPRSVRTNPFIRRLFGFEAELALKNFRRNTRKYRATIVSLVISLVLFLTVSAYVQFGIMYSKSNSAQITYDIYLYIGDITSAERSNITNQIAELPETESISTVRGEYMFLISDSDIRTDLTIGLDYNGGNVDVYISAYDDASFADYARSIGADPEDYMDPLHPKGILVNHAIDYNSETGKRTIGDILTISKGSTLTAGYLTDTSYPSQEGMEPATDIHSTDFAVGEITEELPSGTIFGGFWGVTLIIPESVHEALFSEINTDQTQVPEPTSYIRSSDSKALEMQIRDILKTVPTSQTTLYNVSAAHEEDQKSMFLLGVFVYGFITLISLICIANIFNTITTNVALRQKEFAMLRSVGMTPESFNRMIRFESIFYGLKSLVLGLPISVLIAYYLYRHEMYVYSFEFSLPWMSYLVAILLVFVLVFSTMLYSVSRVNKTNIVDTLKMDTM